MLQGRNARRFWLVTVHVVIWHISFPCDSSQRGEQLAEQLLIVDHFHLTSAGNYNKSYQFGSYLLPMPAAGSKRKSAVGGGPGSKSARLSASLQRQTPLRQSSRVKKKAIVLVKQRALKRSGQESSEDDDGKGNANSASDSDYMSAKSEAANEGETPDDDDSDDNVGSDGPQSYSIPLPKVRDAGDTPYEDARIHPNTFLFLRDLKANNNRDWLKCESNLCRT